MNRYSYLGRALEALIFILIILVIFLTYGEELAVYFNLSVAMRRYLLVASFCFDAIFSVEFIARLIVSGKRRKTGRYLLREGGIIDFLASLPLLVLSSGPILFMTYLSGDAGIVMPVMGALGLGAAGKIRFLKIFKTIRIIRLFRFIRAMKLFGKVKTRYVMTPRYVGAPILIVITVSIAVLIGVTYFEDQRIIKPRAEELRSVLAPTVELEEPENFHLFFSGSESLLFIEADGETVFRNIEAEAFEIGYFNDDYYTVQMGDYTVYLDRKDVKRTYAMINMMVFDIIIASIILITLIYRPFFNRHIASATSVMLRGFKTTDYSTPVRVQENRREFEIYQLAEQYNKKWLPIKRRIIEIKRAKGQ
jgi:hypothetical protein